MQYGDKPDVIIQGEQRIGVEIANLYRADGHDLSSEQTQRHLREEVLRAAKALYLAGGKAIELTVAFNPTHPIRDKKSLASALAAAAKSIDKLPVGPVNRARFHQIPKVGLSITTRSNILTRFGVPLRFIRYPTCRFVGSPRSLKKSIRSYPPTDPAMPTGCCSLSTLLTLLKIRTFVGPIPALACHRSSTRSSSTSRSSPNGRRYRRDMTPNPP